MVVKLEAKELLRDTPLFRKHLTKAENDIEAFDTIYRKISDTCQVFYNDGQKYLDSFRLMIDSFEYLKLILSDRDEEFSQNKVRNFCSLLKEARQSEEACLNDAHKIITEKIRTFSEGEMKRLKDTRKLFEKATSDLDAMYQKNVDVSKSKQVQCDEIEKSLSTCRRVFEAEGSEYMQNVNQFYAMRNDSILSKS